MKRSVGVVGWGGGYQNVKEDVLTIGYLTLDDYLPSHYRLFNLQATASANSLPPESQSRTKVMRISCLGGCRFRILIFDGILLEMLDKG